MVYGVIYKSKNRNFTYLREIFNGIGNVQVNYNWLLTDIECYPESLDLYNFFNKECIFLSGRDLDSLVKKEDFRFIWCVLSGFQSDVSKEDILKFSFPYADGNKELWKVPLKMQHPLASIQIVSWDGELFLVLCKDNEVIDNFKKNFPFSEDLKKYIDGI